MTPDQDALDTAGAADAARVHWAHLHARGDLTAVGQSGLSLGINEWLYRNGARNLDRFLTESGLDGPPGAVFDVGAGTGYWTAYWLGRGARTVDGCDLVPEAVERLREAYGTTGTFTETDVSAADGLGSSGRRYDLVSCMNVLLHVLDEVAFDRAATNIAALVSPGGHLLLAEPIARDPTFATVPGPGDTSRVRSLSRYARAFEAAGLRLVRDAPTTLLGANPIESRPRRLLLLWRAWWGLVVWASRLSSRLGGLAGRLIYALDPLALRTGAAPSGKFALFRRDVTSS